MENWVFFHFPPPASAILLYGKVFNIMWYNHNIHIHTDTSNNFACFFSFLGKMAFRISSYVEWNVFWLNRYLIFEALSFSNGVNTEGFDINFFSHKILYNCTHWHSHTHTDFVVESSKRFPYKKVKPSTPTYTTGNFQSQVFEIKKIIWHISSK